jgi:hypothetical protein
MFRNKQISDYNVYGMYSPTRDLIQIPISKNGIFWMFFSSNRDDHAYYIDSKDLLTADYNVSVAKLYNADPIPVASGVIRSRTTESNKVVVHIDNLGI